MSNTNFTFDKDVLSKSNQSDCVDTNGIVRNGLVYMIYRNKDDNPVKIIVFKQARKSLNLDSWD